MIRIDFTKRKFLEIYQNLSTDFFSYETPHEPRPFARGLGQDELSLLPVEYYV
jgi:hypothetical protein